MFVSQAMHLQCATTLCKALTPARHSATGWECARSRVVNTLSTTLSTVKKEAVTLF